MKIIIPMSGIGKRFLQEGYDKPKPLLDVDGMPMIQHVVNLFPNEKDIYFICNDKHLKETNMKNLLENIIPSCKIFEVPVKDRQGPVHAVSQIFKHIPEKEEIIVSYCDYGTVWDYQKFLQDTREREADGAIACYKGFHPHMLGTDNYAFLQETEKESSWMSKIKEKEPFTSNKMNEYASNGTYYFRTGEIMKKYFKKLMDLELKLKGEYYVSMVYNLLVEDNLKVSIFKIEKMLQWGTPYDLEIYKGWSNYFSNLEKKQIPFVDKLGTTLILPMAGRGSRFSKEGYQKPKPFLDVDGKEMILQAVNCLPETKEKVFICLKHHDKDYDLEKLLSKEYSNSRIYQIESVTEGQACTCEIGLNLDNFDLEKPILISACDNGVYYDTEKYQKLIDDETNDIIVWSFRNQQTSKNNPDMYAWLDVDSEDNIKHVSCKKFIYDDPLKTHAIIGTMFFRKAKYFIDGLKKNYTENIRTNGEFYVDDVLNQNIKEGLRVKVFEVKNYICWGTPDDYKTYNYWLEYF
jgi:bifunctional N-acetylglucosamine-1-phosphate-uridyltransferase/glucosamine-1-phosphate-acetyltransferase GlmU-like protein